MSAATPTPPLFREQALQAQAVTLFGAPALPRDRVGAWMVATALAVAAVLIAGLCAVPYASRETVSGYLQPAAGVSQVVATRAGVVERVHVRDGDLVSAGQPLLTVGSPRATADIADVDRQLITRLEQDRAALLAQIDRETALADAAGRHADERQANLGEQLRTAVARLDNARARAALRERELERLLSLDGGGHVAAVVLDERRERLLQASDEVATLQGEVQRLHHERLAVRAEREQRPLQLALQLAERQLALQALERVLAEAHSRREWRLTSPVAGRVTALTVHPGAPVSVQQPLLAVVPDAAALQAELLVPPRAIGFVRSGQPVRLRYDAFPYQKFGLHGGTVTSVSRTVLPPEQQQGPLRAGVPVYRVLVALDAQTVNAYGEPVPLQPGQTLQADLLRERRRIAEWLLAPLIAAGRTL